MRARGIRTATALALLLVLDGGGLARAQAPRILALEPARTDSLLVCRLRTSGLPGAEILSTLRSGLSSAVDLQLEVLDGRGRAIDGRVLRLRLDYDLWDEVFSIAQDDRGTTRLPDDAALRAWFERTPWLPVAPLAALANTGPVRLRAALRLHAIAPSERERLGEVVSGPDGQEVSLGLGKLIRYFYRGGARARDGATAESPPFAPGEVAHARD
ncbi:MAG: hypothetical protein C0395_08305 [Gemmatimonas sp.]|nr:hypothetical protein [Gemmatimonas sp.]